MSSRIAALEITFSSSFSVLDSMSLVLSEAEEVSKNLSWNQVRDLHEAQKIMQFLVDLAETSR